MIALALLLLTPVLSFSATRSNNPTPLQPQATWEQVGRSLLQLKSIGVPDDILMMTRLDIPNLCRVHVGESTIPGAGRGLFASTDCQKGDLLTCYPGDVLLQPSGMTGVPDELKQDDARLRLLLSRYCIGVRDGYAIMGLPDLADDMAYAGHLINDGARPPVRESELSRYLEESTSMANVEHSSLENIHLVCVAKRDIKQGEELFVFYGPTYWMDHTDTWIGEDDDGAEGNEAKN